MEGGETPVPPVLQQRAGRKHTAAQANSPWHVGSAACARGLQEALNRLGDVACPPCPKAMNAHNFPERKAIVWSETPAHAASPAFCLNMGVSGSRHRCTTIISMVSRFWVASAARGLACMYQTGKERGGRAAVGTSTQTYTKSCGHGPGRQGARLAALPGGAKGQGCKG